MLALLLIYLALGILSGVMTILWTVRQTDRPETEAADDVCGVGWVLDPDAADTRLPGGPTEVEQNVTIAGIGAVTVPAGERFAAGDFFNPEENAGLYDMVFELRLLDGSPQGYEVLYSSALVSPGKHIYEIELAHALKTGVYDAVVHVQPYRMDQGHTRTNNADIMTALVVR